MLLPMIKKLLVSNRLKEFFYASLTGILSTIISLWAFRENPSSLTKNSIPLGGDGLILSNFFNAVRQSSLLDIWTGNVRNSNIGWPATSDFSLFPIGNLFEVTIFKIAFSIFGDVETGNLIHVVSILKSLAIGVISYLCIKAIVKINYLSIIFGCVYTTNSFNLIRAEGHFFLALTWVIPIAVYVLYKTFYDEDTIQINKINTIKMTALSFLIGLTHFYYVLFFLIIGLALVFLKSFYLNNRLSSTKNNFLYILRRIKLQFFSVFCAGMGLLVQIIPVVIQRNNKMSLSSISDRSPTEAYIFSGNLESLLYEPTTFVLKRLNRTDLVNYLSTQIQWESTQVGLVAAIGFVVSLFLIIFKISTPYYRSLFQGMEQKISIGKFEPEILFTILCIFVSLLLYLRSPINYSISRVLSPIRAWGRIEIYLGLFILILLAILIKKLDTIYKSIVLILIVIIHIVNVNDFRVTRVPSKSLNVVSKQIYAQNKVTIDKLNQIFKYKCNIVQVPIYPYPEFDIADDANSDYGLLSLSTTTNKFRWSYGSIKSTQDFIGFQNLVSEFPNFSRASLQTQIAFATKLGPCGVIVDSSYLKMEEKNEMSAIAQSFHLSNDCLIELPGEKFNKGSRYTLINFKNNECASKWREIAQEIEFLSDFSKSKIPLYRIDTPYSKGFKGIFEMFPGDSQISVRWIPNAGADLKLIVHIESGNKRIIRNNQVCYIYQGSQKQCQEPQEIKPDYYSIYIKRDFVPKKLTQFDFSLDNVDPGTDLSWGVILQEA